MGDNKAFEAEIQAWNTAQLASKHEIQMNEAGKVMRILLFFLRAYVTDIYFRLFRHFRIVLSISNFA